MMQTCRTSVQIFRYHSLLIAEAPAAAAVAAAATAAAALVAITAAIQSIRLLPSFMLQLHLLLLTTLLSQPAQALRQCGCGFFAMHCAICLPLRLPSGWSISCISLGKL